MSFSLCQSSWQRYRQSSKIIRLRQGLEHFFKQSSQQMRYPLALCRERPLLTDQHESASQITYRKKSLQQEPPERRTFGGNLTIIVSNNRAGTCGKVSQIW